MIEEKKRQQARKLARKTKQMMKKATFNLDVLRKWVYRYQHRLAESHWR